MGTPIQGVSPFTPDYTTIPNPYYDCEGKLDTSGQKFKCTLEPVVTSKSSEQLHKNFTERGHGEENEV